MKLIGIINGLVFCLAINAFPISLTLADKYADMAKADDQPGSLMYAPWRQSYAAQQERLRPSVFNFAGRQQADQCVFCKQIGENNDAKYLILKRFKYCFVMMNANPFSMGHIMILPLTHKAFLHELAPEELNQLTKVITLATTILDTVIKPEGLNIGFNLGPASGASIPSHLHGQIVPRWTGDSAFLAVIAKTRVITTDIPMVYQALKDAFATHPADY